MFKDPYWRQLTLCSEVASSALVASSNAKMAGFFRSALAIANLCLWPPERLNLPTKKDQRVLAAYFVEHLTWCIEALGHPPHKVAICF